MRRCNRRKRKRGSVSVAGLVSSVLACGGGLTLRTRYLVLSVYRVGLGNKYNTVGATCVGRILLVSLLNDGEGGGWGDNDLFIEGY